MFKHVIWSNLVACESVPPVMLGFYIFIHIVSHGHMSDHVINVQICLNGQRFFAEVLPLADPEDSFPRIPTLSALKEEEFFLAFLGS